LQKRLQAASGVKVGRRFGSACESAGAAAVVCVLRRDAAGAAVEGLGGELPGVAEALADGAAHEPTELPG
jgi:hypothetical protein